MRSSIRSQLLVVAWTIALGALLGCGGGPKQNAEKVLDQTFSGQRSVRSGKLNLTVVVEAKGISGFNGPVRISLTGPFEGQGRRLPTFDLDLKMADGGRTFNAGAISAGGKGFIRFQGASYGVPDSLVAGFKQGFERARAQRMAAGRPSPAALDINPRRWLKDPEIEGDADVAGQPTTHIRSDIDVPRLLDDVIRVLQKAGQLGVAPNRELPTNLSASQKQAVARSLEDPKVEVFSGKDDKILRKLTVDFRFKVPGGQQQRANGLKSGKVTIDLELADVNRLQTVRAPVKSKPFAALRGALSGLGGLVLPGATLGGSPGSRPPSAGGAGGATSGTPSVQAYAQCVTAAGGDVSKAQGCAKLLPSR